MDAYVLHSIPYKETSLIVELFTKEEGRIPVIAKGAKRKNSSLRSVLVSFQPLSVNFTGKAEVRTLTSAEWKGGALAPDGQALFAAYYLNELLLKGLRREDAHELLYDGYSRALEALAQGMDLQVAVRFFELLLLKELGFGLDFEQDARGDAINEQLHYAWHNDCGWQATRPEQMNKELICLMIGKDIVALGQGEISREVAQQCKPLTRYLLGKHISPDGILSRTWMEQLIRA